jgi:hypothetical protein
MTNRQAIERLFHSLWSQGDLGVIEDLYSEEFEAHYFTHPPGAQERPASRPS